MKVYLIERTNLKDEVGIAGICKTLPDANRHIAKLIGEGFEFIVRWDITECRVIEN